MISVSVIMPVYNAKRYICQAVKSILDQTFSNLELIMVDDCGTDGSIDLVKDTFDDRRIKYIKNSKNMGIAYSRNVGMEMAKGEYIAFMDDDDVAPIDRLSKELEFLCNHPNLDAVGGRYCSIDESDEIISYSDDTLQNPLYIKACLMFFDPIGNGSMLFRRKIIIENNIRFKDNCYGMEDYLFWIDFSKVGLISNLREVMLYWRNVKGNETSRYSNEKKEKRAEKYAEIQKYALEQNGFKLLKEDADFLTIMLPEGRFEKGVSFDDIKRLYEILSTIIRQAKKKNMDNYNEIIIACRKQFSRRLEYSEVWNF